MPALGHEEVEVCSDPSFFLPSEAAHGVGNGGQNVIMQSLALGEPQLGCVHMIVC